MRSRAQPMRSPADISAPGFLTTTALTASPQRSSGTPITATSATPDGRTRRFRLRRGNAEQQFEKDIAALVEMGGAGLRTDALVDQGIGEMACKSGRVAAWTRTISARLAIWIVMGPSVQCQTWSVQGLMGKRILVTGGAGFLGSHLCARLLSAGHDVLCVDNYFTGTKDNIAACMDNKHFELMRHDVTFPLYVEVDEIYNLACPASPVHYQHDPVQTTKTSVHG